MKRVGVIILLRLACSLLLTAGLVVGFVFEEQVFRNAFFAKKAKTVEKRIADVRKRCAEKFPLRMAFVTLNGGLVRACGRHLCNGIVRMSTGNMLVDPNPKRVNMKRAALSTARFAAFCRERGARFFFVSLPKKVDAARSMLPPGEVDHADENVDELLASLVAQKVEALDWRRVFAATPEDVRANFFRTDHHWKIDTAFRASGMLAQAIAERCDVDAESRQKAVRLFDAENWTRTVRSGTFLGSLGRRVGPLYAGKDDHVILKPSFETWMRMDIPSMKRHFKGSFADTVMRRLKEVEAADGDAFSLDAYTSLYIGGLYPLVCHENPSAPIDRKVLLVGDSFSRPVEGFLSVVFRRLHFVDPRRCDAGFSLARYVERERPDIVVQALNPSTLPVHSMVGVKTKLPIMFEYGIPKDGEK